MGKTYYAFSHTYGGSMRDDKGRMIGKVYSFPNQQSRNEWVSDGPEYQDEKGYREAIPAKIAKKYRDDFYY